MYPWICVSNTLLIDDTLYKSLFNESFSAIFLESFDGVYGDDHYLLGIVLPYLESLHLFWYGVSTFVHHNPFGRIRCINRTDPGQFKMLFVKCGNGCIPSFCNNAKLKMKQIFFINYSS
jgi:hypothetical protein